MIGKGMESRVGVIFFYFTDSLRTNDGGEGNFVVYRVVVRKRMHFTAFPGGFPGSLMNQPD